MSVSKVAKEQVQPLWLSSDKPRTLISDKLCIEGFKAALSPLEVKSMDMGNLESPKEFSEPGLIFMPWYADESFRELSRQLKKGKDETFQAKAQKEKDFLERMQGYMSEEFAGKGITDALFRMTFFYEILECEAHWKQNDKKSSFTAQVNAADAKKIRELAKWVWHYQYFVLEEGRKVGKALVQEILEDAKQSKFILVSAHDFTILVVLSTLGLQSHPEQLMNFSSYLKIDISKNGQVTKVNNLILNADPFQGSNKTKLLSTGEVKIRL